MTLSYVLLPEKKVFIERMEGKVTMEGLLRAISIIWSEDKYRPEFGGVLDLTNADLLLSPAEIIELSQMLIADNKAATGRFALLVNKPFETALSMIFETKMKPKQEINIYTELESAAWFLQLPMEDFELLNTEQAKVFEIETIPTDRETGKS